jgi:DNA-binding NtrC family response regulator
MIRILIVDDEQDWRTLITNALPDYRVETAASYREARDLLSEDVPYDAAIVDLNLVGQAVVANLGKRFLRHLQDNHQTTLRIVVTGASLGSVGSLVKDYGLTELFFKKDMDLGDVGDVIERELAASDLPPDVRDSRGDTWEDFSQWRKSVRHHIDGRIGKLERERRGAALDSEAHRQAVAALAALNARKEAFEGDCSGVAAMLANVRHQAHLHDAKDAFTKLRGKYDDAA